MAIAYRSGSTAGNGSGGNVTITKPTGVVDGDILVAVCYNEISLTAWTPPAGWTQWGSGRASTSMYLNVFWKRSSSEGADYIFSIASTWRVIAMAAFSGCLASGDPIDVGPTGNSGGSGSNNVALTITTTEADTMVVACHGNYDGGNLADVDSSYTQATGGYLGGTEIWYQAKAGAGATGNKTWNHAGDSYWATLHLAIKQASGASPVTVNLSAAALTASPQAITITPGAVSISLNAASLTAGPQAVTPSAGGSPVSVNLSAAALTASAQALTVTPGAASIALASASITAAPPGLTVANSLASHNVQIGNQYFDGSMGQVVRTSAGAVYTIAPNCDSYPDFSTNGLTQTIRVFKGNSATPSSFSRQDSSNEPAAAVGCAAAIDGSDIIHIAWCARSSISLTRYLRYAQFDTSTDTWGSVTTILSNLDYDDIGQGDENIAMAIDANGKAHIVFLTTVGSGDIADRRIYYTNNVSGSWAAAVQVDSEISYSAGWKAWHPGIAFDEDGRIIASWLGGQYNAVADGTVYIRTRETNGTWNSTVTILGSVETGIDQCVKVMTTAGRYHLAFSGAKSGGWQPIKYYYSDNDGVSWTANNPSISTHNVTVGPGDDFGIRLYHHGQGTPVNIYYVEGAGGAGAWGSAVEYAAGYYDCSVNARWSQYHYNYPQYADIAYWNETYANVGYFGMDEIATDVTVNLSAAAITSSPQSATATPGAVSISLNAAALTASPQAITPTPGIVTVSLGVVVMIASPQTITTTAGAVSVSLSSATLTASPQAITPAPGAMSISLSAAALNVNPQAILVSAPPAGTVQVDLSAATINAAPQGVAIVPGAATLSLSVAAIAAGAQTITAQAPEPDIQVVLNSAILAATPGLVTVGPGAVTINMQAATLIAAVQSLGAITGSWIFLNAAILTSAAQRLQSVGLSPTIYRDAEDILAVDAISASLLRAKEDILLAESITAELREYEDIL